jgi:tryptophan-rich sensory protein
MTDWTSWLSLAGFIGAVFAAATTGAVFKPGQWYRDLAKPTWTPPDWAFPVVWAVLYLMIAVSGWLVWEATAGWERTFLIGVYLLQLALNAGWSVIFFGFRNPRLALVEVAAMWFSIAVLIVLFWPVSMTASLLLIPYLVWVSIAAALNAEIVRLNRPGRAPAE